MIISKVFRKNATSRWPLEDFGLSFSKKVSLLHLWNIKYEKIKVELET